MSLLPASQAAMCSVLWFGTLTHFTQHTFIPCARAKGARGRFVPEEKPFPFYSSDRSNGNARAIGGIWTPQGYMPLLKLTNTCFSIAEYKKKKKKKKKKNLRMSPRANPKVNK